MSLGRIFKFAKPKNPGYGIAANFYMSVLAGHAQMPSALQIANPRGEGGAVEGFLAPLMSGVSKEDLGRPLVRGVYALASKDRKTVLKMRVLSKEEAMFDPEAIARSPLSRSIDPEALARIRATWTLIQLTFETHDAMVSPALAFLYAAVRRMAELTEGVVADPIAQRYMLPGDLPRPSAEGHPDAASHVSVRHYERDGVRSAFTLGLQKFALPEFEIRELASEDERAAGVVLLSVAQALLNGEKIAVGDRAGTFEVAPGGLDRGQWEGIAVHELIPPRGQSVSECLKQWMLSQNRI